MLTLSCSPGPRDLIFKPVRKPSHSRVADAHSKGRYALLGPSRTRFATAIVHSLIFAQKILDLAEILAGRMRERNGGRFVETVSTFLHLHPLRKRNYH